MTKYRNYKGFTIFINNDKEKEMCGYRISIFANETIERCENSKVYFLDSYKQIDSIDNALSWVNYFNEQQKVFN